MILSFAVLSVLTIIQIPREWLRHKPTRILLIIFHTIGIAGLVLILFVVYRMQDGLLREIIVWTETCYFTVLAFSLLLAVARHLGFELARHFRHRKNPAPSQQPHGIFPCGGHRFRRCFRVGLSNQVAVTE